MIVDASVAVKWLYVEDGTPQANALVAQPTLIAPELIFAELANAVWKRKRRGEARAAPGRLMSIATVFTEIVSLHTLFGRAAELALALNHPAYGCCYLALAEVRDLPLVTADTRFIGVCAGTPHARRLLFLETTA